MYVCVCVCVCVFVHTQHRTCSISHAHDMARAHTHALICVRERQVAPIKLRLYEAYELLLIQSRYIHTSICIRAGTYIRAFMCVCMHTYVYLCVCMYQAAAIRSTHTQTTHTQSHHTHAQQNGGTGSEQIHRNPQRRKRFSGRAPWPLLRPSPSQARSQGDL